MDDWSDTQYLSLDGKTLKFSVRLSFWIDANKLPAGLEVGDSFPAPDHFDSLRDSLLDEYDVEDKIKETQDLFNSGINGYSVDSDVASSSSSVISALFSSFGFVLIPLFVMFFGALVLRIILRKAVS